VFLCSLFLITIVIVYLREIRVNFSWRFQRLFLHLYNRKKTRFMHDRLKRFLEMEGLSPARFAEELGIQRSGVTHLLDGRNKPSFAFLQKMMTAYPELNYEWLILGKGRPYKGDYVPEKTTSSGFEQDIFTEPDDFGTEENEDYTSDYQEFGEESKASQPAENRKSDDHPADTPKTGKKITRILVFYNDGTYEEK